MIFSLAPSSLLKVTWIAAIDYVNQLSTVQVLDPRGLFYVFG